MGSCRRRFRGSFCKIVTNRRFLFNKSSFLVRKFVCQDSSTERYVWTTEVKFLMVPVDAHQDVKKQGNNRNFTSISLVLTLKEGHEGVKWELGLTFFFFWTGKMGFTALGVGFNHWERDKQFRKWEWDFPSLPVCDTII